jgi:predicted DNA-binding protein with PD1-like motif
MDWKGIGRNYLIRLHPGEELVSSLDQWVQMVGLLGGTLEGLGGVRDVKLAYFDLDQKSYHEWSNPGNWELVHLWGNLTHREGEPFWHIHAVISDRQGNCKAGHLISAEISVTAELVIRPWSESVQRVPDELTGLSLWHLEE